MDYYYFTSGDDSLQHHGIKGMKWGVRRYQDSKGRYTAEGRKRYIANKTRGINRDIRSFKPYSKTGIRDKNGNLMLSPEDVNDSISSLKTLRDKRSNKYGKKYDRAIEKERHSVSKQYRKASEDLKRDIRRTSQKRVIDAYNKTADEFNNGKIDKFNRDWNRKHGEDSHGDDYLNAYSRTFDKAYRKNYNSALSEFYRDNKNYAKAKQLMDDYKMTEWDDTAKKESKIFAEILENLDKY